MTVSKIKSEGAYTTAGRMNHDVRTRKIVTAARRVFLQSGFEGASMDEVALEAGVSKRTVYNRYISKEDLFDDVVLEASEHLFGFSFDKPLDTPIQDYLTELGDLILSMRFAPDALSLLRNVYFRAYRMESLSQGYEKFGVEPVIRTMTDFLNAKADNQNTPHYDVTEAAWTFFTLIREPLETRLLTSADHQIDVADASRKQVRQAVSKFCKLYGFAS